MVHKSVTPEKNIYTIDNPLKFKLLVNELVNQPPQQWNKVQ